MGGRGSSSGRGVRVSSSTKFKFNNSNVKKIIFTRDNGMNFTFEKIGQLVVVPKLALDIVEVDELPITDRGTGGFGSTDKQSTINEDSSSTDDNQQIRA